MPNCAILGQSDTASAEQDTDLAPLQHAVNHLLHDLALAAELHRIVQPSIRTCPLAA